MNNDNEGNIGVGGMYAQFAEDMTLNDLVEQPFYDRMRSSFAPGDTEIWYRRNSLNKSHELSFMKVDPPKISELSNQYILLGKIAETHLETIFRLLQDWVWAADCFSPGALFIKKMGLEHSSFSVGDVIKIGENAWMCAAAGWTKLLP